nr:uncharacterized protein LOC127339668 [Lolium perenne]
MVQTARGARQQRHRRAGAGIELLSREVNASSLRSSGSVDRRASSCGGGPRGGDLGVVVGCGGGHAWGRPSKGPAAHCGQAAAWGGWPTAGSSWAKDWGAAQLRVQGAARGGPEGGLRPTCGSRLKR